MTTYKELIIQKLANFKIFIEEKFKDNKMINQLVVEMNSASIEVFVTYKTVYFST